MLASFLEYFGSLAEEQAGKERKKSVGESEQIEQKGSLRKGAK